MFYLIVADADMVPATLIAVRDNQNKPVDVSNLSISDWNNVRKCINRTVRELKRRRVVKQLLQTTSPN